MGSSIKLIDSYAELNRLFQVRAKTYLTSGKSSPECETEREHFLTKKIKVYALYAREEGREEIVGGVSVHFISDFLLWTPYDHSYSFPDLSNTLELGRLFLDSNHRDFRHLLNLIHAVHRDLRLSGRRYLVISSDLRLRRLYERMCFKPNGAIFTKNQQGKLAPLQVLIADHKQLGVYGLFAGPMKWCLFMKPMIDELKQTHGYQLSLRERVVYAIYSLFNPLSLKGLKIK